MSTFEELKRRNVFRVAAAYIVASWLIAQIADIVLNNIGAPEWVIQTLFLVLGIGFVAALIVAWIYELTPDGVKRESDVVRDDSITHLTATKLDYVTIAAAIGVAGMFAWQQFGSATNTASVGIEPVALVASTVDDGEKTIAVLPFVNMSSEADNEYFSDGISEELLNILVRVDGLRVASRTSAFSFKGRDVDIPTVASALNVDNIVDGSVRRAGNQVRITAQLIDVRSDSHLWSGTYTRELSDVFAIQDEIATAIADALQLTLLGDSGGRRTDDIEAYDLYLLGRHHFHLRTGESLAKAIELFEESIEADPEFALAYSGLADTYSLIFQYSDFDARVAIPKAEENARKAVELAPELAEAWASLGLSLAVQGLPEARNYYRRAIELNPDYSMAYMWLGTTLPNRPIEALEVFRAAERVDPLHPVIAENIGDMLSRTGQFDEAASHLDEAIADHPQMALLDVRRSAVEFARGNLAEAYRYARRAIAKDASSTYALGAITHAEMDLGNLDRSEAWLEEFRTTAPNHFDVLFATVGLYEAQGRFDELAKIVEARLGRSGTGDRGQNTKLIIEAMIAARTGDFDTSLRNLDLLTDVTDMPQDLRIFILTQRTFAQYHLDRHGSAQGTADEALALAAEMRSAGVNQPWLSENEALLYAALGRDDEAVERFQAAYDQGHRNVYGFSLMWMMDTLLGDDDRYLQIKADIYADVANQQEAMEIERQRCDEQPESCLLASINDVSEL